jgi:SAM-dependent methyltransferase
MTERAFALLAMRPGEVVLDLASGMGQDTRALASRRKRSGMTIGLEPSHRMIRWGQEQERRLPGVAERVFWVRGLAEELPLRGGVVDAILCKGAMDHFQSPRQAMREIARVLRPGGRLVIALANYDSLSCRLGRWRDRLQGRRGRGEIVGRAYYDPPPDHLSRFGYHDIVALSQPPLRVTRIRGLSLLWLFPPWSRFLEYLPRPCATAALNVACAAGQLVAAMADVLLIRAEKAA